ncbi:hypothetical protein TRVA0_037S01464 [Trichomonascus vanleenenianus]|uniref:F-box protein n=1 Tax=Trichomonascus vanleenenianus TaxID=2268995 RepID=UPI003ECADF4C
MDLPSELWMLVFEYLDVPDLASCALVSHLFRSLALDRHVQRTRFRRAIVELDREIEERPSGKQLFERRILASASQLSPGCDPERLRLVLRLALQLRRDALSRQLRSRPTTQELLERGILKRGGAHAGAIQALQWHKAQDAVKRLYASEDRPSLVTAIRKGLLCVSDNANGNVDNAHLQPVRVLARRFERHRPPVPSRRGPAPTRAYVQRLRRQFEQIDPSPIRQPLKRQCTGVSLGIVESLRQQFLQLT